MNIGKPLKRKEYETDYLQFAVQHDHDRRFVYRDGKGAGSPQQVDQQNEV